MTEDVTDRVRVRRIMHYLHQQAATLLTHYAIALLHALSTAADDAALRAACGWRWQVALRARAVGIAVAWQEVWGEGG